MSVSPPHHGTPVFRGIKIIQTSFEKSHLRNIPVKLFLNRTSGFRQEDISRNFSCLYLPSMSVDRSKFCKQFLKESPKEHSCEIISKLDQGFRRRFFKNFFMSIYCKKSPPPPNGSYVFRQIKILLTNFEKGHPRNIPVKLCQNQTRGFRQEDFLRISSCSLSFPAFPPPPPPPWWTSF